MNQHQRTANKIIQRALDNIKEEDILHRGFLKPIQIALKTDKNQPDNPRFRPGSLPRGLKIAVRESYETDRRIYQNIKEFKYDRSYDQLQAQNQDNILSLMKRSDIKLAICVCMFREDKKMLKSTLRGVEENIANLVAYQNMDPDDIGVFVMIDGIQQIDSSIVNYFEELERGSNINLGDNIVPSLTMKQMAERGMYMSVEEIDQIQIKNVNNYLFDVAELEERNNIRLPQVKKEYNQIKQLQKQIQKLKEGRPLFDDLHPKLRPYFYEQAKQERKRDYAMTDLDIEQEYKDQLSRYRFETKLHNDYALDIQKARPLVMKALQDGQKFCSDYIQIREDLAHLTCFRKKVPFSKQILEKVREQNTERQSIYQDQAQERQKYTIMNLFMCVKYKNGGKLSSHNWFFNGFCQELRPQFAILLDVGLTPQNQALMRMYRYLNKNKRETVKDSQGVEKQKEKGGVGGVCGYMSIKIEKVEDSEQMQDQDVDFVTGITSKFTDIQRTQQVEYHFAHLMDKGFESCFSFIHVLPGAFSAYNMKAIVDYDDQQDDDLLRDYFKSIGEKLKNKTIVKSEISLGQMFLKTFLPDFINDCFVSLDPESEQAMLYRENVYLAEDRILCMGIHKRGYDMSYLPDAYAEVDPIKSVHLLLGQRKRWINGSYFAFESVKNQLKEYQKQNGCEIFLRLQILYLSLMNTLSYFAPAFFLFTVHISMQAFRADVLVNLLKGVVADPNASQFYNSFVFTMDFIYVLLVLTILFYSLHLSNKHKRFIPYLYGISTILGIYMICVFLVLVVDIFRGLIDNASFLQQNAALIQTLTGGMKIVTILRWLLVGSVLIYALPLTIYILLFGKAHILCEVILGGFSFLFFGPTYLIILNIYSICRIDDFAWGTKGLDSSKNQNEELKHTWKWIKILHVLKYIVWNAIISAILVTLGSGYSLRFFVTLVMIVIISLLMSVKVVLSCLYMLKYWCVYRPRDEQPRINHQSTIDTIVKEHERSIMQQIRQHLQGVKKQYIKQQSFNVSFIQAARKGDKARDAFKKRKQLQQSRSSIVLKKGEKNRPKPLDLATIREQSYEIKKSTQKKQSKPSESGSEKRLKSEEEGEIDVTVGSNAYIPITNEQVESPKKNLQKGFDTSEAFSPLKKPTDKDKFKRKK